MRLWSERADQEIEASHHQKKLVLWNSLPDYLNYVADRLSTATERNKARMVCDFIESTKIGKEHGQQRARTVDYTIDQVIFEYHILRQVICDVLEEDAPLTGIELEVITSSIERAVNNAATQFSNSLLDIQETLTHTVVHDLRNPITAAKSNAQLILRRPDESDLCIGAASRIVLDMERLNSMIGDLLDASRVRAGQGLALQFDMCDLDVIARQVAEEFNFTYPGRFVTDAQGKCTGY